MASATAPSGKGRAAPIPNPAGVPVPSADPNAPAEVRYASEDHKAFMVAGGFTVPR